MFETSGSSACPQNKKIVLASGSPRRIEMMRTRGIEPLVMPADIEENLPKVHGMCETVMFLALKKAQDVAQQLSSLPDCTEKPEEGSIIIAADTIVYKGGEIMGKPADRDDAYRMLDKLRNDFHYVVTGVALLSYGRQLTRVFAEVTKVYFKDYPDSELESYLDTDEAYDKAGAYAIQGGAARFVETLDGSFENVVGFPVEVVGELLKHFGF